MSKKMKLISHSEYEKLIASSKEPQILRNSALSNQLHRNEAALSEILNWESLSDDIKLALFNSAAKGLREKFVALTETPLLVEFSKHDTTPNSEESHTTMPTISH